VHPSELIPAHQALLAHNATVYVAGRDQAKAKKAIDELQVSTGKEARFLELDLGSLQSVKAAAAELAAKEPAVHLLFNNALVFLSSCGWAAETDEYFSGVMNPPMEKLTADVYDLQWGTNVLG
jgi:retinol dehydrogenase-12